MKEKNIQTIFNILEKTYQGNWQYRWNNTPYLTTMSKEGKHESIIGHVWSMAELWFLLRRALPTLNKIVNSLEIYEIILNHDLGETFVGDVPLYDKINGRHDNKENEKAAIHELLVEFPDIQSEVVNQFEQFEEKVDNISKLEVLVAKWIDNIQGNHYVFSFGEDLPEYSEPINKILQIKFVAYTNRLIEVLNEKGEDTAVEEVKSVARFHRKLIKSKGIKFDSSTLNL